MKSAGNESESRDDRFPGQFFFVSTQAPAGPEKNEGFEEPVAVGKVTLHSLDYWVIDSGATYSMTFRADLLTELEPSPVKHVTSALGQRAEVKGMGKAMFKGADGKMVGLKNQLVKNEMVAGIRVKGDPDEVLGCPTCMQAKCTHYPFSSSEATAKAPLDEVVMDVVGPLKLGAAGAEYFLTIVDVYTRMTWVYVLSKKTDVAETVKTDWLPMVERQQDRRSTTTRQSSIVNGGEEAKDAEEEEEEVQQWLFKIKSDADGKIEHYKSRLVAKGYQQKEKVDYKELFAPVVKPTTLRTLLAGAAIKGWVVKQMDVTTAFLNGVLEEEIFMAQLEGFDDGSGRVLKLKKTLYGLKQAPRQWYLKLRGVLEEMGFTPSTADHSLFMLGEGEQRSFMVVYVDDILIFSPSSDLVKEVMLKLQDKFKCKALGDVSFYLGLHIERDVEKRCMRVHQRKYLEALAANFGQSEGHVATPFPSGFTCVKGPEEESIGEEERRRFHSLVGSLMYAAVNTRPDVAFATGQLCTWVSLSHIGVPEVRRVSTVGYGDP
ncbi:unnamed protein product [Closterium sp. NIES-54]